MSERETRDFMSVDSFSQLPFIRSAPPLRDKNSSSSSPVGPGAAAVRLFGIEFPQEPDPSEDESSSKDNTGGGGASSGTNGGNSANVSSGSGGAGDSGRKFECHYCCRNFPTSQALGGHQNAHKRERQHAKRAYLQSAMAAHHHQAHGYGVVNYNHHLGQMSSTARFGIGRPFEPPPPPSHYPSWGTAAAAGSLVGARYYGGPGSVSQPINGSPLPWMWRISPVQGSGGLVPAQRDRSTALPLLGGDEPSGMGSMVVVGGGSGITGSSSSSSSPQGRLVRDPPAGVQDHLSLDLHL